MSFRAFHALPALPGKVLPDAASNPDVIVREIPAGKHGNYYAVAHIGMEACRQVTIALPKQGARYDAATGTRIGTKGQALTLDFDPFELRSLRVD